MKVNSDQSKSFEYKSDDISGLKKSMIFAVKNSRRSNKINWSNDNQRLFLNIKEIEDENPSKKKEKLKDKKATINIWHWKDKKLISQQMIESKRTKFYKAVLNLKTKKIIQLTNSEIQNLIREPGTDKWAVGTDNRKHLSDWDVSKNDLYRIDLKTGERKLIFEKYDGRININPVGEKIIFWKDGHYWYYRFRDHKQENITDNLEISFINKEHDLYGSKPAYGFVGWVKDHNSIIVRHKLDLWQLPLDKKSKAINLTINERKNDSIRFRFDDMSFKRKPEIEKRFINLLKPIILYAFNIKTKHAGYFQLLGTKLKKLIYKPAIFSSSRWRWRSDIIKAKHADKIIYKIGSYKNYPESYLSDSSFSKSKKLTTTNPQAAKYKWGHRILIDYTNDEGVPLQAILSVPNDYKKGQRFPMMVYTYEKLSDALFKYPSPRISGASIIEMMYVSDGYLFLQPDIHFNVGTPHSDMHECIEAAIKKVIELGYVDEKHIGYEGFSFGGHCGMYISTQKNKFAAIAAGAGVSNLIQGFNIDLVRDGTNEQDYYMTQQGRLGASPADKPEMYIRESAVFNAKNMNTPLLLFHGTADSVVLWEHSFGLYSILRFLKKPVIFLSYGGEGHGLRKKANRLDIQKRLKEYFDHYLKGKKAPQWIINGLPYKKKHVKKDGKKVKPRAVPMWK